MPEEEAFAVFVKIMYEYGLRELFKASFKALHITLYQVITCGVVICMSRRRVCDDGDGVVGASD
jgi:hypothetical protein